MKHILFLSLFSLVLLITSCKEDAVGPNGLNYSSTDYDIEFYTTGQTGSPIISWNGNTGTFGLANAISGVSINAITGVVSWDEDLEIGDSTVDILATNANGTTSTSLTLNHLFSGSFTGSYNYDPSDTSVSGDGYNLTFNDDGSMTASDFGTMAPGTWEFDNQGRINGSYLYDGSSTPIDITADLHYSSSQTPYVDGFWGSNSMNSGYFRVDFD